MTYQELIPTIVNIWANNIESPRTQEEKVAYYCLRSEEVQSTLLGSSKQQIFSQAWKAYKRLSTEEEKRKADAKGGAYWSVWG